MTDREKVINGLECCMSEKICNSPCPYKGQCDDGGYYFSKAIEDAIGLLKEQEQKKVKNVVGTAVFAMGECPSCGVELNTSFLKGQRKTKFCYNCGQAVKWDE